MRTSDNEIIQLYGQIVQYSIQIDGIVKHGTTAMGVLLAAALGVGGASGAIIALSPLIILAPLHSLVLNRKMNLTRIATYIREYAGPDWQYERRLHSFRHRPAKDNLDARWESYEFATNGLFIILGIVSLAFSLALSVRAMLTIPGRHNWILFLAPTVGTIAWCIYTRRKWKKMAGGGMAQDLEAQCSDRWSKIAAEEAGETGGKQERG